jgi:hypothetical protein
VSSNESPNVLAINGSDGETLQLRDVLPFLRPGDQLLTRVLNPYNRHPGRPSLVDEGSDVGDDRVPPIGIRNDSVLDVDHNHGGVWSI